MVDAIARADEGGLMLDHATWLDLATTVDWLFDNWDRTEAGIWETRGGPQAFTYGRLMTWVAFDRAIRLARSRGRPADLSRWGAERDRVYHQIMLAAIDRTLVSDSLAYRYDPSASPDGLRGSEGTFSMCTFWYVQALARAGRLREARIVFEKMFTYANHLGLFSEEIGPSGEQLGNFPQAFSHLPLINTAAVLDQLLEEAGPGADDDRGPR